ncbi:MAG: 50S ribosomal protein L24 [Deltaproteobacteria bacterium]|nr:MAG: 50S ribosomal protein L24 [Deltaproteobacteria bacterium]
MAARIRKGDMVVVTKGREVGKRGRVKRIVGERAEIEKIMMVKRHTRPTQKNPQGGIVDKEGTVALPNVMLWCEKCARGRRCRIHIEDGVKTRVCVKCGTAFAAA